jgi:hypothetical protein
METHFPASRSVVHSETRQASGPEIVGATIGYASIVCGGLIAAVTSPLDLSKGSWLAAYLVLISGLAQVLLAQQSRILRAQQPQTRSAALVLVAWVLGNFSVVAGSLMRVPLIVDFGGLLLMAALISALLGTQHATRRALAWLLRLSYAAVFISIPVGLVLAHLRAM